jgi:hypothetical protein
MRIVTRPDFDGVVCAVLIQDVETITAPIKWVEPSDMQKGLVEISPVDIVANLPYGNGCAMWFDHHFTNPVNRPFKGLFRIAPSAAGLVHEYYRGRFSKDFSEIIEKTDRIDSADLTENEVRRPENYPYVLLSMTISGRPLQDEFYWNRLVELIGRHDLGEVIRDPEVAARCRQVTAENLEFKDILTRHTRMEGCVSVTDLREYDIAPRGNRFLVYALYPEAKVSVKIRYEGPEKNRIILSVGHSIFNPGCRVNAGLLLSRFEGGGHRGAASCTFDPHKADNYIPRILDILKKNEPNEPQAA